MRLQGGMKDNGWAVHSEHPIFLELSAKLVKVFGLEAKKFCKLIVTDTVIVVTVSALNL